MASQNEISIIDRIVAAANTLREKVSPGKREQLISLVNELINTDFHALIQLLYRIDVDERKLKALLKANADIDSATIIADLIISRQLQKIATKQQWHDSEKPLNDNSS